MTIRFTDFIQIKDAASFKDAFEESVSKKVFEALEAKKIEVAQGFFGESHKGMCPECDKPMAKCSCEESVQESASSERKGDASANGYRAHSIQVADAAASAAADHHKMLFQSHISKHAEATGAGDSQAAHHHMEKAKMHASVHYEMTGKHVYEETNTGFGDHYPTEKNPKARIKGSLPGTKDYPTAPNAGFKGKVPSLGMKIRDKTNEEVEQVDESLTHTLMHGAALGAGALGGIGALALGKHMVKSAVHSAHNTIMRNRIKKATEQRRNTMFAKTKDAAEKEGHKVDVSSMHVQGSASAIHPNHTVHFNSDKGPHKWNPRTGTITKHTGSSVKEEVDNKHGKVALKVTKKLMKIAHKHAKKHHEEEE